jgi:hypothetical protein
MKKCLVRCLMVGAFLVVMTGVPLQLFHVRSIESAHAMGRRPGSIYDTPEPGTLSVLVTGIAGLGTYLTIRRRSKGKEK